MFDQIKKLSMVWMCVFFMCVGSVWATTMTDSELGYCVWRGAVVFEHLENPSLCHDSEEYDKVVAYNKKEVVALFQMLDSSSDISLEDFDQRLDQDILQICQNGRLRKLGKYVKKADISLEGIFKPRMDDLAKDTKGTMMYEMLFYLRIMGMAQD